MTASALSAPRARAVPTTAVRLLAIAALAALVRLWGFARVPANPFYDAAVRSMAMSWHNFFFGAFEPSAQVAVDKLPADLWLQVASVKLFGFGSVALRLPEVLAGIVAVPLLYDLVRRLFGARAGLCAAAALAVLPAAILTAHSDTMDSVMMALDLLAAWLVVVGAPSRRIGFVVAAGAVLGLAFNVKLLQALIVAPALAVLVLMTVEGSWRRRALALGGSLGAFVAVSLAWITVASLTPLGRRPWPIGSTDGSIWNAVFVYNGLERLRGTASAHALQLDPPGPLRLFQAAGQHYATTVGTSLLAALVLGVVALVLTRPRDRLARAGVAFFGVWLLVGVALLSHMQRMEPRYLEAVTPAIAAIAGIGLASLSRHRAALVAAVAVTVAAGAVLAHPPGWAIAVAAVALAACAAHRRRVLALALIAVLAIPSAGALAVARAHQSDAGLPVPPPSTALSAFLIGHQGNARYEVASPTVFRSSTLIIHDARPVLMLTSIDAQPLLSAAQLSRLVSTGQVRYMLGRGTCGASRCPPVVQWARAHAHDVSAQAGLPQGTLTRLTTP